MIIRGSVRITFTYIEYHRDHKARTETLGNIIPFDSEIIYFMC